MYVHIKGIKLRKGIEPTMLKHKKITRYIKTELHENKALLASGKFIIYFHYTVNTPSSSNPGAPCPVARITDPKRVEEEVRLNCRTPKVYFVGV